MRGRTGQAAAQCLRSQVAHAALGRRSLRGTASKRPALKLGGDKEKFRSLAFFQKLRLVRRSLTALNRRSPTKNPGAKAPRARKGDRLALRPFYANNKRTSKPKLGCPFFISAIYPGHCLQAAPGMTMSLVFLRLRRFKAVRLRLTNRSF